MAHEASVAHRASQPTPASPIRAQKQKRSISQASKLFRETLEDLKELDAKAKVETDPETGWVRTVRGRFAIGRPLPPKEQRQFRYMVSARELGDHPTVEFLQRFSALFGLTDPLDQLFLRGITPLPQGDWFAFGIDIFTTGRGNAAQIDVVVAPNGRVIYAGFGSAGEVPKRG